MSNRPETVPQDQDKQAMRDQEFTRRAAALFEESLADIPLEALEKLERTRKAAVVAASKGRKH